MPATRSPLDRIKIASPCTADWRFMLGNDLVRFCGQCNKNVYNLSAMKREEAEDADTQNGRAVVRAVLHAQGRDHLDLGLPGRTSRIQAARLANQNRNLRSVNKLLRKHRTCSHCLVKKSRYGFLSLGALRLNILWV